LGPPGWSREAASVPAGLRSRQLKAIRPPAGRPWVPLQRPKTSVCQPNRISGIRWLVFRDRYYRAPPILPGPGRQSKSPSQSLGGRPALWGDTVKTGRRMMFNHQGGLYSQHGTPIYYHSSPVSGYLVILNGEGGLNDVIGLSLDTPGNGLM
jgi:hypothetical protein